MNPDEKRNIAQALAEEILSSINEDFVADSTSPLIPNGDFHEILGLIRGARVIIE